MTYQIISESYFYNPGVKLSDRLGLTLIPPFPKSQKIQSIQ